MAAFETTKADQDARLLAEAAALGVLDPSVWEAYMAGWITNVKQRINEQFGANSGPGTQGSVGGAVAGVGDSSPAGS